MQSCCSTGYFWHAEGQRDRRGVECRVKKPASTKASMLVSELYPQVEETYDALARDVTEEDMDWFRSELCGTQCGMTWLLSPEPQPQPQHQALPTVPQLVREHRALGLEAVLASLGLSEDQRLAVQTATMGQRANPQWQQHRQGRLTASNFGAVLSRRSSAPCPSLLKRILGGQNLDGVLSVNWGVMNEAEGVKAFKKAYQVEVLDCGLFLSKSVWTTKEAIIIPIPKDPAWTQHLDVLEEFYRQPVLPVLVDM
ncbi:unnamed protein product [Arctogadus glacialis]